jgi:hypothetical protein
VVKIDFDTERRNVMEDREGVGWDGMGWDGMG